MSRNPSSSITPPPIGSAPLVSMTDMAVDTLAAILRILGEYAQDQEKQEAGAFAAEADQWAQHVALGTPPPVAGRAVAPPALRPNGAAQASSQRRDLHGVREFVRQYARGTSVHSRAVLGDLRQVIWVFIQSLNHSFSQDADSDGRMTEQLSRLERLAHSAPSSELKREALSAAVSMTSLVEERRRRQAAQMEQLGAQVRALGHELETVKRESEVDPLTRLFNRKGFDEYLSRSLELYRAFGQETCLMLIDVDHFKAINDTHGHTTGDAVLCRLADAVTRVFLRKNDFVARYGGDELAVVLRETSPRDAIMLSDRLLKAARGASLERDGGLVEVSISVGVAPVRPGDDPRSWINRADRALYDAKNAGRDRAKLIES